MRFPRTLLAAATFAAAPAALAAQDASLGLRAGIAVPVGGAADTRTVGPSAALSLDLRTGRRLGVRVDAEWTRLTAGASSFAPGAPPSRALHATGLSLSGVLRPGAGAPGPYLLAGIGVHRLQEPGGDRNPYGTTGALHLGAGMELAPRGGFAPFVETRALVHATDYGSREWSPTVYLPLQVGVRIR